MAKPLWLKRTIAYYTIILFISDIGSDGYVCYDLFDRCHVHYGISVFIFFWLPGFLSGGLMFGEFFSNLGYYDYILLKMDPNFKSVLVFMLGTILGPIVFIPMGLYYLIDFAREIESKDPDERAKEQAEERSKL